MDEYDNTTLTLGTNAPLLGRGLTQSITHDPGENQTVIMLAYDRETILRICGSAPTCWAGNEGEGTPTYAKIKHRLVFPDLK